MLIENPILRGFHPDPCLCRAHGKYYLATSTFQWLPGVSLYESEDLVSWRSVGGALEELDLRGVPDSAGVWAPDLTFDEASGLFWLVYTVAMQIDGIFKDVKNYVVTSPSIQGPWSEPVFINASGFDPGVYHEGGRHYVLNPQWDPRPLPGHHRFNGLILQEFSLEQGLIGAARKVLGNEDAVNWLREGPHIMRNDGLYYIACAEGGTGRRHRIRMARSRDLWGPYEVCSEPLVCAWCQDTPLRKSGHGNFVQDDAGNWFVCHLCSRYLPEGGQRPVFDEGESGISPLGRETAIEPVVWVDGWPRLPFGGAVPMAAFELSAGHGLVEEAELSRETRRYETSFAAGTDLWAEEWLVPRRINGAWWSLGDGGLMLRGGDSPSSLFERSSLSRRATSFEWRAEAELAFDPSHYNQTAGLICEYDARAFHYLHVAWDEGRACRVIDVLSCDNGSFSMPLGREARVVVPASVRVVRLGVEIHNADLRFFCAFDDGEFGPVLGENGDVLVLDATIMSDEHVCGWAYTGTMVGVTCVDCFDKSTRALFSRFAYEELA
jgi:xylan 1,4-beta-xylosidase